MSDEGGGGSRSGFAGLMGWTNVGKSTLLNRLVGEKIAAVADVPQTTRNRITGVRAVPGRGQIVLVDTPGFHQAKRRLNRAMIEHARRALGSVDVAVLIVDAAHGLGPGDAEAARAVRGAGVPAIAALNKIDVVRPKTALLPMLDTVVREWGLLEAIPISALTGEGCDLLVDRLLAHLPEAAPLFPDDFLTDQPERQLASEWIREKIIWLTREEIPHSVAVRVERWVEREDGLVAIDAVIYVERESQKGIVIGKGGALLKQAGSEARHEIERLLDARVFLGLQVEVHPGWRDDERELHDLGLV